MLSNQIVKSILQKKNEFVDSVPQDYFVGATSNPEKRLFNEHNVSKVKGFYTFFEARSEFEAKKAFNKLLKNDMNGFPLNGYIPGKYVYCYYIEGASNECYSEFE